jgi:Domain of unknown function (DUF4442)
MSNAESFLRLIKNPFKFRIFLFTKLPSAFFAGVRVLSADEKTCIVTVPYKWFSQNPFKSTYFACLSMAAEMSTGVLAMAHVYKRNPQISMLVMKVLGDFTKKAVGRTTFTCDEGLVIKQTIEDAISSKEGRIITARSYGRNAAGEVVAQFEITWSFKVKSNIS